MNPTTAVFPVAPPAPVGPAVPRLSVEQFLARYHDAPNAELVDGVVKEQHRTTPHHGFLCARMTILIGIYLQANDLGRVMSNDTRVQVSAESVRGGDVLFFSYERLPRGEMPRGLLPVAPDLVVEVKSPSDRWGELFAKVGHYLGAGVRVVVVLDPETATASVYRDEGQRILGAADALELPDVLPGFSVAVARLFA